MPNAPVAVAAAIFLQVATSTPTVNREPPVRSATDFGHIEVHRLDAAIATSEGLAAKAAASEALSLPDVRFAIVEASYAKTGWGEPSAEQYPTYPWAFKHGADPRSLRPPDYVLRHEIGHDLFVRYLVPNTRPGQYGGDAPDWLDEMAAVAFEADAQRTSRRCAAALYAASSTLIALPRLLSMTHPEMKSRSPPPSPDETFRMTQPASADTGQFYATIAAFYDFLVERTKSVAIVADLATAFRRGERLDRWLSARTGHGDRQDGLDALNADFLSWVAADRQDAARKVPRAECNR